MRNYGYDPAPTAHGRYQALGALCSRHSRLVLYLALQSLERPAAEVIGQLNRPLCASWIYVGSSRAVFSSRPIAFCMAETDLAARSDARPSGNVLQDPAEIAEAHGGIHALGHLRRLQARRLTSAGERVMKVDSGQRRAQSAPPGALQRYDVIERES